MGNTSSARRPGTGQQVAAACLLCRYKVWMVDTPVGSPDTVVAACRKCGSLTCGWHGILNNSPKFLCVLCDADLLASSAGLQAWWAASGRAVLPRWPPPVNVPISLAAEAAGDSEKGGDLARALASVFATANGTPSRQVVLSLDEWLTARPDYLRLMSTLSASIDRAVKEFDRLLRPEPKGGWRDSRARAPLGPPQNRGRYSLDDIQALWLLLDAHGRQLLAAAVLLTVVLDLPTNRMPTPVADVVSLLGDMVRQMLSDEIDGIRREITPQR